MARADNDFHTSITDLLHVDILLQILEILHTESPKSIPKIALASKELYIIAQPYIYRSIRFVFNRTNRQFNRPLLQRLIDDSSLSANVQSIWVPWGPKGIPRHEDDGSLEDLHLLAKLLPHLKKLQTFVWEAQYQIPPWLLDGLCKGHLECRLFLRLPYSSNIAHAIARIRDCHHLCSLEITIANSQQQGFAELDQLLTQTRTLRSLSIKFFIDDQLSSIPASARRDNSLCTWFDGTDITYSIKTCATLERLSLENYDLDHKVEWSPDTLRLRQLTITNLSFLVPNLALDPMSLRSLYVRIPGHITQSSEQICAFRSFLAQCRNLQDLDVNGAVDVFDEPLLANIGKNLLCFRFQEIKTLPIMDHVLSPGVISHNCPRLKRFGIDIGHSRRWVDWPYDVLSSVTESLISLTQLDIYVLNDKVKSPARKRHGITFSSVLQVWEFIWLKMESKRRSEGCIIPQPRLQSVKVIVGSEIPRYQLYDNERAGLYEQDQLSFEVQISDRAEEAEKGIAYVKCPELEALKAKFGAYPPVNHWQEKLLEGMNNRVEDGIPFVDGTDLYAAKDLTRPLRMPFIDFDP